MSFLLNPRVLIALALAAALAFSHFTAYRKGKSDVRAEWTAAVAAADQEARRLERARQSAADAAGRLAAARENRLRAAVAGARSELDGLRDDLRAADEYAKQSRAAAERIASTATELLAVCTRSYLDVAEAADRADSEARQLRDAWPK